MVSVIRKNVPVTMSTILTASIATTVANPTSGTLTAAAASPATPIPASFFLSSISSSFSALPFHASPFAVPSPTIEPLAISLSSLLASLTADSSISTANLLRHLLSPPFSLEPKQISALLSQQPPLPVVHQPVITGELTSAGHLLSPNSTLMAPSSLPLLVAVAENPLPSVDGHLSYIAGHSSNAVARDGARNLT